MSCTAIETSIITYAHATRVNVRANPSVLHAKLPIISGNSSFQQYETCCIHAWFTVIWPNTILDYCPLSFLLIPNYSYYSSLRFDTLCIPQHQHAEIQNSPAFLSVHKSRGSSGFVTHHCPAPAITPTPPILSSFRGRGAK
jgi:hypothetical protein